MTANIGTMFYASERPWHNKGRKIEKPATAKEALKFGELDWKVQLINIETAETPPSAITRRKAVVRTDKKAGDPNRVLGVVHPDFHPLQNDEGLRMLDILLGAGQALYETGGYLGHGEVVWVLARLPGEIKVHRQDVVEPYLLFSNSHDGTHAIDLRLTTIRVVCQNTLNLALSDRKSKFIFKQSHSMSARRLQIRAKDFFEFTQNKLRAVEHDFQMLADRSLEQGEFPDFVNELLPLPQPPSSGASEALKKAFETRLMKIEQMRTGILNIYDDGYSTGTEIQPADKSLWGALNAVTAYVDHAHVLQAGDRYAFMMFGQGARLKQMAYQKVLEMAK